MMQDEWEANRQDARIAREHNRELVNKVIEVVEANTKASGAVSITMDSVCSILAEQGRAAAKVAGSVDAIESKVDETLMKVEKVDEGLGKVHEVITGVARTVGSLDKYVRRGPGDGRAR